MKITTPKPNRTTFTEKMILSAAILATSIIYLDQSAVSVALPNIQTNLRANIRDIQWIININLLALSTLLLIGGVLGDMLGRARIYAIGMLWMALTSAACALSQSLNALIFFRFLQGMGGALMVPAGLALINAGVEEKRRTKMLGYWAMVTSIMLSVGPSLAGWLIDTFSWRAIFWLNVPFCVAAVIVAVWFIPENRNDTAVQTIDWLGLSTLFLSLSGLIFALIEATNQSWTALPVLIALGIGVLMFSLFLIVENQVENPLIPLFLFKNRTFSGINLVTLIFFMGLGATFFFIPLNLQQIQGYSAFESGLALMPRVLPLIFLSNAVSTLSDKYGPKPILLLGLTVSAISFFYLAQLGFITNYWITFFPALLLSGIGLAFMVVPLTTIALGALEQRFSGLASGINNAASRIASMLALAILGGIMVVRFKAILAQNTAVTQLPPAIRKTLLQNAGNLGATQIPGGLELAVAQRVETAVQIAFIASFQEIMLLSLGLTLLGIAVLWWSVEN